jgi:tetratricopeptide (TPR) repeat protein
VAKNKGKFGKGKSEIEETDEFVSGVGRLAQKLKPHALRLTLLVVTVALVMVGFAAYNWYGERKAAAATNAYAKVAALAQTPVVEGTEEEPAVTEKDVDGNVLSFASKQERAEAALAAAAALRSEYGSRGPIESVRMVTANQLLVLGRYDEAASEFSAYAQSSTALPGLRLVALEGVGYALEAKAAAIEDANARQGGLEAALEAFKNMQTKKDGPKYDQSLYHQARILTVLNRQDEAVAMFKQILTDNPDTDLKVDNPACRRLHAAHRQTCRCDEQRRWRRRRATSDVAVLEVCRHRPLG